MNAAHLHLLLNHIPILGIGAATIILLLSLTRNWSAIQRPILWLFVVFALLTLLTSRTGELSTDIALLHHGEVSEFIESHEKLAGRAVVSTWFLAGLSVLTLLSGRYTPRITQVLIWLVLLCGLISTALMIIAAYGGGLIAHPELR